MGKCRQRLGLLVRWNVGWHEKNAGKLAAFARGPGQRQMSAMNGIESTTEKANIHAPLVSSFAAPLGKLNILIVIPNKRSLRGEESGRAARSVAFFATQLSRVRLASLIRGHCPIVHPCHVCLDLELIPYEY